MRHRGSEAGLRTCRILRHHRSRRQPCGRPRDLRQWPRLLARPFDEKMRVKRPGPGISRGYNSLAGQSVGLTMGNKSPPDLMESLAFGPFATSDDPYWTEGYGPVHGYPNLFPDDMPQFRRAVTNYWRSMEELSGGGRPRLSHSGVDLAGAHAAGVRSARVADRYQHCSLLQRGIDRASRGTMGAEELKLPIMRWLVAPFTSRVGRKFCAALPMHWRGNENN
jgi:hypothetical protein